MTIVVTGEDGGVDWRLELDGAGVDGDGLLPGRLAEGRLTLQARKQIEARGLVVALRGTEHWQYTRTTSDGKRTRTETVTRTEELPRVPLQALGAVTLAAGETRELAISVPVPSLGPASLDAVVAGVRWILEAKLDVPSGFDSSLEAPVRIHQPTALLRAGVVRVEQFALWEAARGGGDHAHGELELTPMPLCLGQPFEGELRVHLPEAIDLQEVRLEFRVNVKATVSSGRQQLIEAWRARIVEPGRVESGDHVIRIAGQLPPLSVPTIQLPHGRSDVMARIVFARAWARDHHIDRDISFCTTTEL